MSRRLGDDTFCCGVTESGDSVLLNFKTFYFRVRFGELFQFSLVVDIRFGEGKTGSAGGTIGFDIGNAFDLF